MAKPNGKTKPFVQQPTGQSALDDRPRPKEVGWRKLGFSQFYPSMDPNAPPAYLLELQGQRTDDTVFTVKIALDKGKIDMIPSPEIALKVCRDAILNGLTQLDQFRLCACNVDHSCKEHQRQ